MQNLILTEKIQQILKQLLFRFKQLAAVLQKEHHILSAQEFKLLTATIDEKQSVTHEIISLKKSCQNILVENEIYTDLNTLLTQQEHIFGKQLDVIKNLWQKLKQTSQDCEQQNAVNGIVIQHMQNRTESILSLLYGNAQQQEIYKASGGKENTDNSKILARA